MTRIPSGLPLAEAFKASRIGLASTVIIPLIIVAIFGIYVAAATMDSTSLNCVEYSCVQVTVISNSSITDMTVTLAPVPPQCAQQACIIWPRCNHPSNFCSTVNTQSKTDSFMFQGVKQGYYWLGFTAHAGINATEGAIQITGRPIATLAVQIENQTIYHVVTNITAGLATAKISIGSNNNSSSSSS